MNQQLTAAENGDRDHQLYRRLERCPACGYSLHGLPLDHRCPECGLPYDRHSRSWTNRCVRTKRLFYGTISRVMSAVMLVVIIRLTVLPYATGVVLLAGAIVWAALCISAVRAGLRSEFVLVGRNGIHWRTDGNAVSTVSWAAIDKVHVRSVADRAFIHLQLRSGKDRIDLSPVLCDAGDAEPFYAVLRSASYPAINPMLALGAEAETESHHESNANPSAA